MFQCFNWHRVKLFVLSYLVYAAISIGWYCFLMKDFYREKFAALSQMGDMGQMSWFSSTHLLIYLAWALVVKGIIIFVLPRTHGDHMRALILGAIYGLIVGGAHQILNLALVSGWPMESLYYDIPFMMALSAAVTVFAIYAAEWCGCAKMCNLHCEKDEKGMKACR